MSLSHTLLHVYSPLRIRVLAGLGISLHVFMFAGHAYMFLSHAWTNDAPAGHTYISSCSPRYVAMFAVHTRLHTCWRRMLAGVGWAVSATARYDRG